MFLLTFAIHEFLSQANPKVFNIVIKNQNVLPTFEQSYLISNLLLFELTIPIIHKLSLLVSSSAAGIVTLFTEIKEE